MDTTMKIELAFTENDTFRAEAEIVPDASVTDQFFSFILNRDLAIWEIQCNGKRIDFEKVSEETPAFRPPSQRIVFRSGEKIRHIVIRYSGSVAFSFENRTCWHNILTDDIKSLSWYSVWFPQETSMEIAHDKVVLLNGKDYFLVKGVFDESRNVWEYGDKGYDPFNVMAYRKEALKTISNPAMNIYFVDGSIWEQAERLESAYRDILDFYNGNLFGQIEMPVLDVACASPAIKLGGGYRRRDLMWTTSLGHDDQETSWLLAHETAHIWCSGADCGSWEDWLNESTAEWASLLFALHQNNTALFDFILKPKLERHNALPAIKTPDGSRPDGVHDKGTVLFYEMFKMLGVEAVRLVVRAFTDLPCKNTASLLQTLYQEHNDTIADFIQEGIDR